MLCFYTFPAVTRRLSKSDGDRRVLVEHIKFLDLEAKSSQLAGLLSVMLYF
jgi:hypothetical protein